MIIGFVCDSAAAGAGGWSSDLRPGQMLPTQLCSCTERTASMEPPEGNVERAA